MSGFSLINPQRWDKTCVYVDLSINGKGRKITLLITFMCQPHPSLRMFLSFPSDTKPASTPIRGPAGFKVGLMGSAGHGLQAG